MKRGTPQHPKTRTLARLLGIELYAAVGLLEMLWHFTAQYAPAGDIGRWRDDEIADAVGWSRDAGALITGLVSARWLDRGEDGRLCVHDWWEHAEDGIHMKLARAGQRFADGRVPKLSQFEKGERQRLSGVYENQVRVAVVENSVQAVDEEGPRKGIDEATERPRQGNCLSLSLSLSPCPAPRVREADGDGDGPVDEPTLPAPAAPRPERGDDLGNETSDEPVMRDPEQGPEWCEPELWAEACRLADAIEDSPTGARVAGRRGLERAGHVARLLQDAGKGKVCRLSRENCVEAIGKLAGGRDWLKDQVLRDLLVGMQRYPDGVYPERENAMTNGDGGEFVPSRVEQAWRIIHRQNGGTFAKVGEATTAVLNGARNGGVNGRMGRRSRPG